MEIRNLLVVALMTASIKLWNRIRDYVMSIQPSTLKYWTCIGNFITHISCETKKKQCKLASN